MNKIATKNLAVVCHAIQIKHKNKAQCTQAPEIVEASNDSMESKACSIIKLFTIFFHIRYIS